MLYMYMTREHAPMSYILLFVLCYTIVIVSIRCCFVAYFISYLLFAALDYFNLVVFVVELLIFECITLFMYIFVVLCLSLCVCFFTEPPWMRLLSLVLLPHFAKRPFKDFALTSQYVHINVVIYIYIYIHICTHTYTYIHYNYININNNYVSLSLSLCVYIYISIYIHIINQ